jgi:hypothetical protein
VLWIATYTNYFHQSHKRPEITRFKIAGEGRVDEYKEGHKQTARERERYMGRKMEKQTYRKIKSRNK